MYAQDFDDDDVAIEEGLDRLLACATTMVWATDAEGFFTFLNPQAAALCDLQGLHVSAWARRIHPEDLVTILPVVRDACIHRTEFTVQYRMVGREGTLRHMTSSGAPHLSGVGDLLGYSGTTEDITDRFRALDSLKDRIDMLNLFSRHGAQLMLH